MKRWGAGARVTPLFHQSRSEEHRWDPAPPPPVRLQRPGSPASSKSAKEQQKGRMGFFNAAPGRRALLGGFGDTRGVEGYMLRHPNQSRERGENAGGPRVVVFEVERPDLGPRYMVRMRQIYRGQLGPSLAGVARDWNPRNKIHVFHLVHLLEDGSRHQAFLSLVPEVELIQLPCPAPLALTQYPTFQCPAVLCRTNTSFSFILHHPF